MAEVWKPKDVTVLRDWIFQSLYHTRRNCVLSDWERDFLVSIDKQLNYGRLSQRQEEILERIYADKT